MNVRFFSLNSPTYTCIFIACCLVIRKNVFTFKIHNTIAMLNTQSANAEIIHQFLAENLSFESVNERLLALGYDEALIPSYLAEFRRVKNARQQSAGFAYLVAGAVLGFISCVLALTNPVPALHDLFLFGLTSIAILSGCLGLYKIFE